MKEIAYRLGQLGDGVITWLSIAASIVAILEVWLNRKQTNAASNKKQ